MITSKYYKFTHDLNNEELFYIICRSIIEKEKDYSLTYVLKKLKSIEIEMSISRSYYINTKVKGEFKANIAPFGGQYDEFLDFEKELIFHPHDYNKDVLYCFPNLSEKKEYSITNFVSNPYYKSIDNITVEYSFNELREKLIDSLEDCSSADYSVREKMNSKRFNGDIEFLDAILIDKPLIVISYTYKNINRVSPLNHEEIIESIEKQLPIPDKYNNKEQKFYSTIEKLKQKVIPNLSRLGIDEIPKF